MKTQSLDAFLIIGRRQSEKKIFGFSTHVYEEDANTENETNPAGQTITLPRRRETGTKWR